MRVAGGQGRGGRRGGAGPPGGRGGGPRRAAAPALRAVPECARGAGRDALRPRVLLALHRRLAQPEARVPALPLALLHGGPCVRLPQRLLSYFALPAALLARCGFRAPSALERRDETRKTRNLGRGLDGCTPSAAAASEQRSAACPPTGCGGMPRACKRLGASSAVGSAPWAAYLASLQGPVKCWGLRGRGGMHSASLVDNSLPLEGMM